MLDHNLIVLSSSAWASPIVVVKKEDGQDRLCIDYRKVNQVTVPDNFPLPRVIDCLDTIGNSQFISKIDLMKGYWQVKLSHRAQKISAFVTPDGFYECAVMPFGMRNAASTFQRLMNLVTKDIPNCVVYLDDVVIFTDSWERHLEILKLLFESLREANLVLNLKKCDSVKGRVTYLGHQIGHGIVVPKSKNVEAISNFPVPINKKQIMRFLGMTGYFRRFIPNYSTIASPLTNLLKKSVNFTWDEDCDTAFNHLKAVLMHNPVLKAPDFSKSFSVAVDASDSGVGGVLLQKKDNNIWHPIAYFSKKLSPCQSRYSTIEKELLAIVMTLKHFEVYIGNKGTTVVLTDHNPLKYLYRVKNSNRRLMRWSLELQDYNIDVQHIKGKDNVLADSLSRVYQ